MEKQSDKYGKRTVVGFTLLFVVVLSPFPVHAATVGQWSSSLLTAAAETAGSAPSFFGELWCTTKSFFHIGSSCGATANEPVTTPSATTTNSLAIQPAAASNRPIPTEKSTSSSTTITKVINASPTYVTNKYITNPTTVVREVVGGTSSGGGSSHTDTANFATKDLLAKQTDEAHGSILKSINNAVSTGILTVSGNSTFSGTLTVAGVVSAPYFTATNAAATSTFAGGIHITSGCFELPDGTCAGSGGGAFTSSGGYTTLNTPSDNVGIGTSSPSAKLTVAGSGVFNDSLTASFFNATSTTATSTFAGGLNVGSGNLTVLQNGNVGVGTESPGEALTVDGAIKTTTAVKDAFSWGTNAQKQALLSLGINAGGFGGGAVSPGRVFATSSSWSSIDAVNMDAGSKGFYGAVFDGRYVYFVPYINGGGPDGQVTRYDTTGSFSDASSWSVFDTAANVDSNSTGFAGAVFDGRYIYFVPSYKSDYSHNGQVTRYDTTGSFTSTSSWSVFDTAANVDSGSKGFTGAVFDGRYIYFVPNNNGSHDGQVTRYDTTGSFTSASSWSVFDTAASVDSGSKGFIGAVFDGRYIYFVPSSNGSFDGQVTRYDTTGSFTSTSSWSVFDTAANVDSHSKGFVGAVFDGRYVYFVPNYNGSYNGQVTRYDTTGSFTSASSWSVFDTAANVDSGSKGFFGAVFDGRYVYFVPNANGQVTRYDTTGSFSDASSWSVFDTVTNVDSNSKGFRGAVFDGRYVYFAQYSNGATVDGQVTRYDTGSPAPQQGISQIARSKDFYLNAAGNIGIGTTSPSTFKLQVAGDIGPDANNSYDLGGAGANWGCLYYDSNTLGTCASDERLKTDITELSFDNSSSTALDQVAGLTLRDFAFKTASTTFYHGLIAQEVEKVAPELVTTDASTTLKSVKYGDVQWLVLQALQELIAKVQHLSDTVAGFASSFTTNKLCIGSTCVNEQQLKELLAKEGVSTASETTGTTGTATSSTSTSTEQVATTADSSSDASTTPSEASTTTATSTPDTTPPSISLTPPLSLTLTVGDTYTDPAYTATDDIDGDITDKVVIGGDTVDTTTPGTYTVTYNVSDAAGNAAEQQTRTITVTAPSTPQSTGTTTSTS